MHARLIFDRRTARRIEFDDADKAQRLVEIGWGIDGNGVGHAAFSPAAVKASGAVNQPARRRIVKQTFRAGAGTGERRAG
ncbi:hypothetical protein GCM10009424_12270 [Sphingomonas ursincola]